ncbi:hypothetical protein LUX02_17625 [Streptomyces somaliensis]|nr:hypothetical protein [Streptomyces somaliensis]
MPMRSRSSDGSAGSSRLPVARRRSIFGSSSSAQSSSSRPGGGEPGPLVVAAEHDERGHPFEVLDAAGDAGLADAECARGAGQAPRVGDGPQHPQVLDLYVHDASANDSSRCAAESSATSFGIRVAIQLSLR